MSAQTSLDLCSDEKSTPDQIISSCTVLIQSGTFDSHNLAVIYTKRGTGHRRNGEWDLATADYTQAVRLDPNFAAAYRERAYNYTTGHTPQPDLAIADQTQALRINAADVKAYVGRSIAYRQKKQYGPAIADATQAIRIAPDYAGAYDQRGHAYRENGQDELAIADYLEAARIGPAWARPSFNASSYKDQGFEYLGKGQDDLAIVRFSQALRIDPNYALTYVGRGDAYEHKGHDELAIADYTQAVRLDPTYWVTYTDRGLAYELNGQHDLAMADWDQAVRLRPNETQRYFDRGVSYIVGGDFNKAGADLAHAVSLDPGYESISYKVLWLHIARLRAGVDDAAEFSTNVAKLEHPNWGPVLDLYAGRRMPGQAFSAPNTAAQKCLAAFYTAEWQLSRHEAAPARAGFAQALGSCERRRYEYRVARAERARLTK